MSKDKAKSLSDLIGADCSGLGQLAHQARRQSDLGEYLRNRLGAPLGDGILHCNIRDENTLVINAMSPEWAARLRFETQRIQTICAEFGQEVAKIKVRVAGQ